MRKIFYYPLLLTAVSIAFSACQTNKQSNETLQNPVTDDSRSKITTKEFVIEAASDGMMEIAMADLALKRTQNPEIKELATTIRKDHQNANKKLKYLASENNWEYPGNMLKEHQAKIDELKSEGGTAGEFDILYLYNLEEGHKKSIKKFEAFSGKGDYVEGTKNLENENLENYSEDDDYTTEGENFQSNNTLKSDSIDDGYIDRQSERHGGVVSNAESDTTGEDLNYTSNTEGNTDGRATESTDKVTNAGTFDDEKYTFEDYDKEDGGIKDTLAPDLLNGNTLTLQGWINETLPVLKKHLRLTQQLHKELRN